MKGIHLRTKSASTAQIIFQTYFQQEVQDIENVVFPLLNALINLTLPKMNKNQNLVSLFSEWTLIGHLQSERRLGSFKMTKILLKEMPTLCKRLNKLLKSSKVREKVFIKLTNNSLNYIKLSLKG